MNIEEKKTVMAAIHHESVLIISLYTEVRIEAINQSSIELDHFSKEIWERTCRNLRRQNLAHLVEREILVEFDKVHTVLGNMQAAYVEDLKESVPPSAEIEKLQLWDKMWRSERRKAKRMKIGDASSLSNKVLREH